MDEQGKALLIASIPPAFSTFREALNSGELVDRREGRSLKLVAPQGTLVSDIYDLFRPSNLLLSCARRDNQGDIGFITPKCVVNLPTNVCYHATPAANDAGIRSSGLLLGRDVPGLVLRDGLYSDSEQYIHASRTEEQAVTWYYDIFGHDQCGVVLAIDLGAARCRLLSDPRSDDGIIETTRIETQYIRSECKRLPSVAKMQAILRDAGWTFEEVAITSTVKASRDGSTICFEGRTLPGAWWKFYNAVAPHSRSRPDSGH